MADSTASFIPKNSNRSEKKLRTTKRIYILSYISYIVFFGTLLATVGTYLYAAQVGATLNDVKSQLQQERNRFAPTDVVEEVKLLDRQLLLAKQLVEESYAPSKIFNDIESITASNIQLTGLKYEYLPNQQFSITLQGQADEFNKILYQQELMSGSALLSGGRMVGYDYSLGETGESDAGFIPAGQATMTFVFSDTNSLASIPYEIEPEPFVDTDNEVLEVEGTAEAEINSTTEPSAVIVEDENI